MYPVFIIFYAILSLRNIEKRKHFCTVLAAFWHCTLALGHLVGTDASLLAFKVFNSTLVDTWWAEPLCLLLLFLLIVLLDVVLLGMLKLVLLLVGRVYLELELVQC